MRLRAWRRRTDILRQFWLVLLFYTCISRWHWLAKLLTPNLLSGRWIEVKPEVFSINPWIVRNAKKTSRLASRYLLFAE